MRMDFLRLALLPVLLLVVSGCDKGPVSRAGLEWFKSAEVYNGWYQPKQNPPEPEVIEQFPFIVWTQPTRHLELVRKLQKKGVKALPYISFYIGYRNPPAPDEPPYTGNWLWLDSPYWKAVNIKDHPEWILIGKNGEERWNFGYRRLCNNSPGFQEAVAEGLRNLMDLGFDGVFIDNVHPDEYCYGPQYGRHDHVHPGETHTESFIRTLKMAYDIVKSYGDDKVVIHNSGGPDKRFAPYADGSMWESYICSWAWPGRSLTWGRSDLTWEEVKEGALKWQDYIASGKRILALSYLYEVPGPTGATHKPQLYDNAFFCYACARYSGFMWADWFTLGYSRARILYKVRLGGPISGMIDRGDLHFRQFERGLVAINSGKKPFKGTIEVKARLERVMDVYRYRYLEVNDGKIRVEIPPWSGRVYWAVEGG